MAKKPQTRFTLDDDERTYLWWLARNIFLCKDDNEAAKHLVKQGISEMRRKHYRDEPALDDMRALTRNAAQNASASEDEEAS